MLDSTVGRGLSHSLRHAPSNMLGQEAHRATPHPRPHQFRFLWVLLLLFFWWRGEE